VRWRYNAHRCGWSSPALADHLLFATFIAHGSCGSRLRNGELLAFSPATGHIRWRKAIGPSESSPLVANGLVYVADQSGRVYAFAARSGRLRWSFDKLLWRTVGFGNVYSTAAITAGRVYVGSVDGHIYAFSAESGDLLWSFGTGSYVAGHLAEPRPHRLLRPRLLCARRGHGLAPLELPPDAPVSGAASVVGGIVYFSTFGHRTYALTAGADHVAREWADGEYSPAVAGYGRLFLVGLGRLYALAPA
jgi:outer membrane protein assembly factor BamB